MVLRHLRGMLRTKYAFVKPELSQREARSLARLVHKYGVETVTEAAQRVRPKRKRGRPRSNLPIYEARELARYFEDAIADHTEAGSRSPVKDAEFELYNILFEKEQKQQPGHFERWRKNIKKQRRRGQPYLVEEKELEERMRQYMKRLSRRK
jgi:hypothetical protein